MVFAAIFVMVVGQRGTWEDRRGKSDSQILRMGRDAWCDLFSAKYGDSNSAHSNALYAYSEAVGRVNNRLLSDPALSHRDKARRLAVLVRKFAVTAISLGDTIDHNTGWGPVGGGLLADAEEAVYGYLRPEGRPKTKPVVVSQVRKALDAQSRLVKEGEELFDQDPKLSKKIRTDYAELYEIYREIVPLVAATTGRAGSDRILGFCLKAADTISY